MNFIKILGMILLLSTIT